MSEKKTGAFDALLADIRGEAAATEDLVKSMAADADGGTDEDDDKIAAAAAEGDEDDKDEDDKGGEKGGEKPFGKSFTVKLADGTETEAVDASDLLKSLIDRVDTNEAGTAEVLTGAMALIKSQGAMLKSLTETVTRLGGQGRQRKAVLTITEKPAGAAEELAKSQAPAGLTSVEFMAKAEAAMHSGKITGRMLAEAEAYVGMGEQPPIATVRAVLA